MYCWSYFILHVLHFIYIEWHLPFLKSPRYEISLLLFNYLEVDFYILSEYCHFTIQFF